MNEVFAVVEGPTEQTFFRDVLSPWLAYQNVIATAIVVGKKGGNKYADARADIVRFLKQRSDTYVTCMFDFYGMGNKWPGREEAANKNHESKPLFVEAAILEDISSAIDDFRPERLIPYVQMHEYEALLFSYPKSLSIALGNQQAESRFQEIRDSFDSPEHINDSPATAPSKRVIKVFKGFKKRYCKPIHGSIAAKQTTIETMINECAHFKSWVSRLVDLGDI
jgi:hypothetical protein